MVHIHDFIAECLDRLLCLSPWISSLLTSLLFDSHIHFHNGLADRWIILLKFIFLWFLLLFTGLLEAFWWFFFILFALVIPRSKGSFWFFFTFIINSNFIGGFVMSLSLQMNIAYGCGRNIISFICRNSCICRNSYIWRWSCIDHLYFTFLGSNCLVYRLLLSNSFLIFWPSFVVVNFVLLLLFLFVLWCLSNCFSLGLLSLEWNHFLIMCNLLIESFFLLFDFLLLILKSFFLLLVFLFLILLQNFFIMLDSNLELLGISFLFFLHFIFLRFLSFFNLLLIRNCLSSKSALFGNSISWWLSGIGSFGGIFLDDSQLHLLIWLLS